MNEMPKNIFFVLNSIESAINREFWMEGQTIPKDSSARLNWFEVNVLRSTVLTSLMSILEFHTNPNFWRNDIITKTWPRWNEFQNLYRVRNSFVHKRGSLDYQDSRAYANEIASFFNNNTGVTPYYTIQNKSGINYIILEEDWKKNLNHLHIDYWKILEANGYDVVI